MNMELPANQEYLTLVRTLSSFDLFYFLLAWQRNEHVVQR
jgi:hypothetical protein